MYIFMLSYNNKQYIVEYIVFICCYLDETKFFIPLDDAMNKN
jgi:hypothetical protein